MRVLDENNPQCPKGRLTLFPWIGNAASLDEVCSRAVMYGRALAEAPPPKGMTLKFERIKAVRLLHPMESWRDGQELFSAIFTRDPDADLTKLDCRPLSK